MRYRFAALALVAVLLAVSVNVAAQEDEERCIEPPTLKPDYEWAYDVGDNRTRYVEVHDRSPTHTPGGRYNVTEFGFEVRDEDGNRQAWGRSHRMANDTGRAWALLSQDTWVKTEEGVARQLDAYNPPLALQWYYSSETCPGDFWRFETEHAVTYGDQRSTSSSETVEEKWSVRATGWTNVTVPEGTYEVLQIDAVRSQDRHTMTTYWSPEVRAPVKIDQGAEGVTTDEQELSWYILDQRPTARFKAQPHEPTVGDTITLNGTPSFDPEGNVTEYRWLVDGETYRGPVVEITPEETKTLRVRLFVTDEANRTSTLGTTMYVAPEEGEGVAVEGPSEAYEGQIVTLEALAHFDPVEVRWRSGSDVVGQGERYQFRMNGTRTLQVDATHRDGYVYTTNHTVQLLNASESGDGSQAETALGPPDAPNSMAILEPLEGQVVPPVFDVRLETKTGATLTADDYPLWSGRAESPVQQTVELEPGRHELELSDGNVSHIVNVTVASGTSGGTGADRASSETGSGAEDATPVPAAGTLAVLASTLAAAAARARAQS